MNYLPALRVVIVDDLESVRSDLRRSLMEYQDVIVVGEAGSVKDALVIIPATKPDIIFLDIRLGDGDGFEILDKLQPVRYKVIFLTAYQEHAIKAIKHSAFDYLLKPL